MNINEWVLSQEWRRGKQGDSIVCDAPPKEVSVHYPPDCNEYYGGFIVAESVLPKIRDHIIEIHNNAIRGDETTSQGDGRD